MPWIDADMYSMFANCVLIGFDRWACGLHSRPTMPPSSSLSAKRDWGSSNWFWEFAQPSRVRVIVMLEALQAALFDFFLIGSAVNRHAHIQFEQHCEGRTHCKLSAVTRFWIIRHHQTIQRLREGHGETSDFFDVFFHSCTSGTGSQRTLLSWTGVTEPLQSWMHVWMFTSVSLWNYVWGAFSNIRDVLVILVVPCLTSLCMGHSTKLKPRKPNQFHLMACHYRLARDRGFHKIDIVQWLRMKQKPCTESPSQWPC